MRIKNSFSIYIVSIITVFVLGCSEESPPPQVKKIEAPKIPENNALISKLPESLKNYLQWESLSGVKAISPRGWAKCRQNYPPSGEVPLHIKTTPNLHTSFEISVHANSKAAKAIKNKTYPLPQGSIIVKEKLKDGKLVAVGAMIKKSESYNKLGNNWKYYYRQDKEASTQGKLETCHGCHLNVVESDYLFLSYMKRAGK